MSSYFRRIISENNNKKILCVDFIRVLKSILKIAMYPPHQKKELGCKLKITKLRIKIRSVEISL